MKVKHLRDVALQDAQTALASVATALSKSGRDGTSTTVIGDLTEPTRLAWDAASKTLWVVEGGTSQQIKRFGDDFKLQATLDARADESKGFIRRKIPTRRRH